MPIGLDPNQRADFWLAIDAAKPVETRPTLELKFLTCRELRTLQDLRKKASEEKDNARCDELINKAIAVILVGWRNIDKPFSPTAVDDVLTLGEKWEILNDGPGKVMLSEHDVKNSAPRLSSDGGKSAEAAGTEPASTPPASTAPSSSGSSAPPAAATP